MTSISNALQPKSGFNNLSEQLYITVCKINPCEPPELNQGFKHLGQTQTSRGSRMPQWMTGS